jgi:hypothetical protein
VEEHSAENKVNDRTEEKRRQVHGTARFYTINGVEMKGPKNNNDPGTDTSVKNLVSYKITSDVFDIENNTLNNSLDNGYDVGFSYKLDGEEDAPGSFIYGQRCLYTTRPPITKSQIDVNNGSQNTSEDSFFLLAVDASSQLLEINDNVTTARLCLKPYDVVFTNSDGFAQASRQENAIEIDNCFNLPLTTSNATTWPKRAPAVRFSGGNQDQVGGEPDINDFELTIQKVQGGKSNQNNIGTATTVKYSDDTSKFTIYNKQNGTVVDNINDIVQGGEYEIDLSGLTGVNSPFDGFGGNLITNTNFSYKITIKLKNTIVTNAFSEDSSSTRLLAPVLPLELDTNTISVPLKVYYPIGNTQSQNSFRDQGLGTFIKYTLPDKKIENENDEFKYDDLYRANGNDVKIYYSGIKRSRTEHKPKEIIGYRVSTKKVSDGPVASFEASNVDFTGSIFPNVTINYGNNNYANKPISELEDGEQYTIKLIESIVTSLDLSNSDTNDPQDNQLYQAKIEFKNKYGYRYQDNLSNTETNFIDYSESSNLDSYRDKTIIPAGKPIKIQNDLSFNVSTLNSVNASGIIVQFKTPNNVDKTQRNYSFDGVNRNSNDIASDISYIHATYTNLTTPGEAPITENIYNFSADLSKKDNLELVPANLVANTDYVYKVGSGSGFTDLTQSSIYKVDLQIVTDIRIDSDTTRPLFIGDSIEACNFPQTGIWDNASNGLFTDKKGLVPPQDPSGLAASILIDAGQNQFKNNGEGTVIKFTTSSNLYYSNDLSSAWHRSGPTGKITHIQLKKTNISDQTSEVYTINPDNIYKAGNLINYDTLSSFSNADAELSITLADDLLFDKSTTNFNSDAIPLKNIFNNNSTPDNAKYKIQIRLLTTEYSNQNNEETNNKYWGAAEDNFTVATQPQIPINVNSDNILNLSKNTLYNDHGVGSVIKFKTPENITNEFGNYPYDGFNSSGTNFDLSFIKITYTDTSDESSKFERIIKDVSHGETTVGINEISGNTEFSFITLGPGAGESDLLNNKEYTVQIQLGSELVDSNDDPLISNLVTQSSNSKLITSKDPMNIITGCSFEKLNISHKQYRVNGENSRFYFELSGNIDGAPWHKAGLESVIDNIQVKIENKTNGGSTNGGIVLNVNSNAIYRADNHAKVSLGEIKTTTYANKTLYFDFDNSTFSKANDGTSLTLENIFPDHKDGAQYSVSLRILTSPFGEDKSDENKFFESDISATFITAKMPEPQTNNIFILRDNLYRDHGIGSQFEMVMPSDNHTDAANFGVLAFDGIQSFSSTNDNSDLLYIEVKYTDANNVILYDNIQGNVYNNRTNSNMSIADVSAGDNIRITTENANLLNNNNYDIQVKLINRLEFKQDNWSDISNLSKDSITTETSLITSEFPNNIFADCSFSQGTYQYRINGERSRLNLELSGNINGAPWHKAGENGIVDNIQLRIEPKQNSVNTNYKIVTIKKDKIKCDSVAGFDFDNLSTTNLAEKNLYIDLLDTTFTDNASGTDIALANLFENHKDGAEYFVKVRAITSPFNHDNQYDDNSFWSDSSGVIKTAMKPPAVSSIEVSSEIGRGQGQADGANTRIKFKIPDVLSVNDIPFDGINDNAPSLSIIDETPENDLSYLEVKYYNNSNNALEAAENISVLVIKTGEKIDIHNLLADNIYQFQTFAIWSGTEFKEKTNGTKLQNNNTYNIKIKLCNSLNFCSEEITLNNFVTQNTLKKDTIHRATMMPNFSGRHGSDDFIKDWVAASFTLQICNHSSRKHI